MKGTPKPIGMPRRWLALLVAVAAGVVAMATPGQAAAGEFTITACQADAGDFASTAFEDFATRGMRWRRACDPLGPGLRGLVTSNVVRSGRVARGAQSAFVLSAPPGTAFSRLRWSGHAQRRDCRYALQLYAERPEGSPVTIKNVRADRNCPRREVAQASSWPRPRAYDLGGATRIVQRVVCVGASSAQFCSARGLNYMQTFTAEATVVDSSAPSVTIGGQRDQPVTDIDVTEARCRQPMNLREPLEAVKEDMLDGAWLTRLLNDRLIYAPQEPHFSRGPLERRVEVANATSPTLLLDNHCVRDYICSVASWGSRRGALLSELSGRLSVCITPPEQTARRCTGYSPASGASRC